MDKNVEDFFNSILKEDPADYSSLPISEGASLARLKYLWSNLKTFVERARRMDYPKELTNISARLRSSAVAAYTVLANKMMTKMQNARSNAKPLQHSVPAKNPEEESPKPITEVAVKEIKVEEKKSEEMAKIVPSINNEVPKVRVAPDPVPVSLESDVAAEKPSIKTEKVTDSKPEGGTSTHTRKKKVAKAS